MKTLFLAALLLVACSSTQPRVCSLSALQLKDEHRDARFAADCALYARLDDCPAAQAVDARYAKLWDEWEQCRH